MSLLFIILNLFILYKIYSLRREKIEILDLYGLYHIWGKCSIWYSMVIKRTDFNYFPLMCMETITKRIRLRFVYLFLYVFCHIEDFR